jgi:hypothetical protein
MECASVPAPLLIVATGEDTVPAAAREAKMDLFSQPRPYYGWAKRRMEKALIARCGGNMPPGNPQRHLARRIEEGPLQETPTASSRLPGASGRQVDRMERYLCKPS